MKQPPSTRCRYSPPNPHEDGTSPSAGKLRAVLEKLFAIEPDHPGVAHYLIHSYDKPQLAQPRIPPRFPVRATESASAAVVQS